MFFHRGCKERVANNDGVGGDFEESRLGIIFLRVLLASWS